MDQLQQYRQSIDQIDTQIIELLAKRFTVVHQVGIYKKEHAIPALQPERWQQVLEEKIVMGSAHNISKTCIQSIWNAVHTEALCIEEGE